MTLPSIVIGLLIALLMGALFHLGFDGGAGRLVLYLLLSLCGFFAGHSVGTALHWQVFALGPLDLGMAVLGSILFLFLGYWLSLVEVGRPGR